MKRLSDEVQPSRVDAFLDARGASKRWLAKKLGITEWSLNRYLSGDRTAPADLYERIADILHLPVSAITPQPKDGAAA